jgi:hypothetical protein
MTVPHEYGILRNAARKSPPAFLDIFYKVSQQDNPRTRVTPVYVVFPDLVFLPSPAYSYWYDVDQLPQHVSPSFPGTSHPMLKWEVPARHLTLMRLPLVDGTQVHLETVRNRPVEILARDHLSTVSYY